jgi:hypothetical protein
MTSAARQGTERAFLAVMRARRPDLVWRPAAGSSNTVTIDVDDEKRGREGESFFRDGRGHPSPSSGEKNERDRGTRAAKQNGRW